MRSSLTARAKRRGYAPTLTGYMASRYAKSFIITLLVLGAFGYLMDVLEVLRATSSKDIQRIVALEMALMKWPALLIQMLPFAVLLSTLLTLYNMNRTYELVALRASGLPARRFLNGPLLVVLAAGLFGLFILNPLSATMLKRYERWYAEVFPGGTRGLVTSGGSIWLKQNEKGHDVFIYGQKVADSGKELINVTVFDFGVQGDLVARVDGERMQLQRGYWEMQDVFHLIPGKAVEWKARVTLPTTLTPAMIRSSFDPPGTLSVWQLGRFIDTLRANGFPSAQHEMTYQRLLAMPVLLIAMFLLGVPFALHFARLRGLGVVMGCGLGLGFGFYLFSNLVATYGTSGRMDVMLAAWLPAAIALLLAAALMLHLREE